MPKLLFLTSSLLINLFLVAQSYPVPKSNIDLKAYTGKESKMEVGQFSISDLISIREFNMYLNSVKMDSSKTFYEKQLPQSAQMKAELVQEILKDPNLQDQAMPGVSWTVARNYCKWMSRNKTDFSGEYSFDLPTVSEYIAFEQYYKPAASILASWTLNVKDESVNEMSETIVNNFKYDAKPNDPPSFKRKIVAGGSFHLHYTVQSHQYEYQDSSSRFIGFRIVRKPIQKPINKTIQLDDIKVSANILNNHFHGIYEEKNNNGTKRVSGEFKHGQRVGIWTVWDSNDVLTQQRIYTNNIDWKMILPEVNNPYKNLYTKYLAFDTARNKDGFYNYCFVEERAVISSTRLWRELNSNNETELFQKVNFQTLVELAIKDNPSWFEYGINADFKTKLTEESIANLKASYKSWDYKRIEVKEDFFLSADKFEGNARQIGISFYKNKRDSLPTFTLYVPHIRSLLVAINFDIAGVSEIKNLDDAFYFNAFRGEIKYSSSIYGRFDSKHTTNDWQKEFERLSTEHTFWIHFTPE